MNYNDYNDYELLYYVSEGNEDANEIIYKKYEPLIRKTAKKMYKYGSKAGLEINDLIQEGMLGLSKAIETFTESKDNMFYTYAKLCIERRIISMIINANRNKSKILNEAISIDATYTDDIEKVFKNDIVNPENILLSEEGINNLYDKANKILTDFEMQVFELKANGFDYKEIADLLDKDTKSIDNAIQRIKNKLKKEISV